MQETGKRLKLHQLGSVGMFLIGLIWVIAGASGENSEPNGFAPLLLLIGLIWYIVTRFRIWWHHK